MPDFTPPIPFETEKDWDKYNSADQANMVNVDGKGIVRCFDKYFFELRDSINFQEEKLGLSITSWIDSEELYLWDKYIEELRTAMERLSPYLMGKTWQEVLYEEFGYYNWCDGEPTTNNYIWDRCIEELRRFLLTETIISIPHYGPGSVLVKYPNPYTDTRDWWGILYDLLTTEQLQYFIDECWLAYQEGGTIVAFGGGTGYEYDGRYNGAKAPDGGVYYYVYGRVRAQQLGLQFDAASIEDIEEKLQKSTSVRLKLNIDEFKNQWEERHGLGPTILKIYEQSDEFGAGDWPKEGALLGEITVPHSGTHWVDIPKSYIKLTGLTRFRLSLENINTEPHVPTTAYGVSSIYGDVSSVSLLQNLSDHQFLVLRGYY